MEDEVLQTELKPAKKRVSRVMDKGRETVKNYSSPVFDAPEAEWSIREGGDGVPVWWKHVSAPKVSKKEREREMKSLNRRSERLDEEKAKLEKRNADYRDKLKRDAERIKESLRVRREHVEAILKQDEDLAEIERLEHELELRKLEEERLQIRENEEKARLEEEENEKLRVLELKRADRRERQRVKKLEAELLVRAEAERAESERAAREERAKLREEQTRAKARLRAERNEMERQAYEEQLRLENEAIEEAQNKQIARDKARLAKIEAEQEKLREERALIEREKKLTEERESALVVLREKTEAKRIRREMKSFKVPDYEYQPYPKTYPASTGEHVVELYETALKSAKGITLFRDCTFAVKERGLTAVTGFSESEARHVTSVIMRATEKGEKVSAGEVRIMGRNALNIKPKEHRRLMAERVYLVPSGADEPQNSGMLVEKYIESVAEKGMLEQVKEMLARLQIYKKSFLKKKLGKCSVGELARLYIACALASRAELTVMIEPQRWLDAPSRMALKELVSEWADEDHSRAVLLFTTDDAILPTEAGRTVDGRAV